MDRIVDRQLKKIEKQEERYLRPRKRMPASQKALRAVEEKIPKGLKLKLESAFFRAFQLVFSRGSALIEKTYRKDNIRTEYEIRDYRFQKNQKRRALRELNNGAVLGNALNVGVCAAEGAVLGVLGIGLPDIPIFIGSLLRGIYGMALNYGFTYDSDGERYWILLLIEASLADGEKMREKNQLVDQVMKDLEDGAAAVYQLDEQMRRTADALATDMLCVKFIQGLPLVGIVGGAANASYSHRITSYAKIKYRKRYLNRKKAG